MIRRLTISVPLAALLLAEPGWVRTAGAQPRSSVEGERALDLFRRGADRYREGRFAEAAALFREAYALKPEPVLLRNLAKAYEGVEGREAAQAAIDAYEEFLRIAPKDPDRGAIEQRIKVLRERIANETRLEQQRDEERRRAESAERARHEAEETARRTARSPIPWIVAGVGAAGLGAGVVFGLLANGRHEAAADAATDVSRAEQDQRTAKTYALVANVSFVAGGLLAAAGLAWGLFETSGAGPKRGARLVMTGSRVSLVLGF